MKLASGLNKIQQTISNGAFDRILGTVIEEIDLKNAWNPQEK